MASSDMDVTLSPCPSCGAMGFVWPCSECGYDDENPPPIEEYPDRTARENGPIVIGQRCPWCGDMVEGPDHTRSHD